MKLHHEMIKKNVQKKQNRKLPNFTSEDKNSLK